MAHAAFKRAASFAAVLIGYKFKVSNRRNMEDRSDCLLLLAIVRYARGNSLEGGNIGLAKFEVVGWLSLYELDRKPWEIAPHINHLRRR